MGLPSFYRLEFSSDTPVRKIRFTEEVREAEDATRKQIDCKYRDHRRSFANLSQNESNSTRTTSN
jgi:hypothetical protein